jgi:hypothetical protein
MDMVEVVLMNNQSDNNVADKVVTTIATVNCALKDPTELMNPTIRLAGDAITSNVNYCYIPALGRYYFVGNKRQVTNGMVEPILHEDVLMSFKESIRQSTALVEVTGNAVNPYIESDIWTPDVRRTTHVKKFESGFNHNPQYILITAGGLAE